MSRVFDAPRYVNQTLYRLLYFCDIANSAVDNSDLRSSFGNPIAKNTCPRTLYTSAVLVDALDSDLLEYDCHAGMPDEELYFNYGLQISAAIRDATKLPQYVATGQTLSRLVNKFRSEGKTIWCDHDATFRLAYQIISHDGMENIQPKVTSQQEWASNTAVDLVQACLVSCRMGKNVSDIVSKKILRYNQYPKDAVTALTINNGVENLRMHSYTRDIKDAHEAMRAGIMDIPLSRFSRKEAQFCSQLGLEDMYRIGGFSFLVYKNNVFVLDYSAIEQIHSVSKFWSGAWTYALNYRPSGDWNNTNFLKAFCNLRDWISTTLGETSFSIQIPRIMKQGVALLQNYIHSQNEVLKVGWEDKDKTLRKDIDNIMHLRKQWYAVILEQDIPDRAKLDIANLYYGLPGPDCSIQDLFSRASEYMEKARQVDPDLWSDFMRYSKSLDFCKVVSKFGPNVSYKTTGGYDFKEEKWFVSCSHGNLMLPPEEDFGKVWLYNHFEFKDTVSSWYYDVGDVTRAEADLAVYDTFESYTSRPKHSVNELLNALENAPYLSGGRLPHEVYKALSEGTDDWDRVVEMAAKSENLKPGKKVRETWSADDITRELTSCYDQTAMPLAQLYAGVTSRKGFVQVEMIFDRLKVLTTPGSKMLTLIMSNDVSGWSPLADRDAWTQHHDYVAETCKVPQGFKLKNIWRDVTAGVCKRGFRQIHPLTKGMFQGFTGTMDTLLNVRLSLYCVRRAKREGHMLANEGAHTAGLIDDAVQGAEFHKRKDETQEEYVNRVQQASDAHYKTTFDTWSAMSAELDNVKTLYSSIKFIYLNRFFCEGSEVFLPMKVFSRADREHNRRFATIHSQFDTVFGSFRAAMEKGGCPILCYFYAVVRCLELAALSDRTLMGRCSLMVLNAAFAPRGLGGWGFAPFSGFVSQECKDRLTSYCTIMCTVIDKLRDNDSHMLGRLSGIFHATLNQRMKVTDSIAIMSTPWEPMAEGVPNPTGSVLSKLKQGMIRKCKSEIFRDVLQRRNSREFEAAFREILSCCSIDIAIMALLYQTFPDAVSAILVDRCYKNELIAQLFPFRVRAELSSIVRKDGAAAIRHLFVISFIDQDYGQCRPSAFSLSQSCRETYYQMNKLTVLNHTTPDYMMSLARQATEENASISVQFSEVIPSCPSEKVNSKPVYINLYDGRPAGELKRVGLTASAFDRTSQAYGGKDPVSRAMDRAAMLAAYVDRVHGSGDLVWSLFCLAWGCITSLPKPMVTVQVKPGASTKRINPHTSHRTHELGCFKNTQLHVNVISKGLARWLDLTHCHVDLMSYVSSARAVGVIEAAAADSPNKYKGIGLHYAFLEDSLVPTSPGALLVDDEDCLRESLMKAVQTVPADYCTLIKSTYEKSVFESGDATEIIEIRYGTGVERPPVVATTSNTMPGYLTQILTSGVPMISKTRKTAVVRKAEGDEMRVRIPVTAETRYRRYSSIVRDSHAAILAVVDIVRDYLPGSGDMNVLSASWWNVPAAFREAFPGWQLVESNIRNLIKRMVTHLTIQSVRSIVGVQQHHILEDIRSLRGSNEDANLLFISCLYCMSYGRPRCEESYRLTSALGMQYIQKCWALAARSRRYNRRTDAQIPQRRAMGSIYSSLAAAANVYQTKEQLVRAMVDGAARYCHEMGRDRELEGRNYLHNFLLPC